MNEKVLAKVDCLADKLLSKIVAKVVHESPDYVKLRILSHLKKLEKKRKAIEDDEEEEAESR